MINRIIMTLLLLTAINTSQAIAGIVITGTRVIYPSDKNFVSVELTNVGNEPALVQSWIDTQDVIADPNTTTAPFIITPPISRIETAKGQSLRILFNNNQKLASDRETLFWLNILDIPAAPKDQTNYLQFAVRNRIKLFYRPHDLNMSFDQSLQKLDVKILDKNTLLISNDSPYYMNFSKSYLINLNNSSKEIPNLLFIEPFSDLKLNIDSLNEMKSAKLSIINDFGSILNIEKSLN